MSCRWVIVNQNANSLFTCLTDKPGPPESFRVTALTEDSVTLKWAEPNDCGGADIDKYHLERRDQGQSRWTKVTSLEEEEEFTVTGLTEGKSYSFRIAAENEVGTGEFAELPKAVVPKSQHGKI